MASNALPWRLCMDFWAVFLAAPLYQLLNAVVAPLVTQGAQGVLELVGTSSNITSPSGGHREMDMEMAPLSPRSVVVTYIGHSWKLLLGCSVGEAFVHQMVFRWLAILPAMVLIALAGAAERMMGPFFGAFLCSVAGWSFVKEVFLSPVHLHPRKGEDKSSDDVQALLTILKSAFLFGLGVFQWATFSTESPAYAAHAHDEWIHHYGAGLLHYLHEASVSCCHYVTMGYLSYALAPPGDPELRLSRLFVYGAVWSTAVYAWGGSPNTMTLVQVHAEARSSCVDGMIWGERAQRGVEMAVTWIQGWALLHATLSRGVEAAVVLQAILGLWSLLINQMIRAALSKQMVPKRLHATML